MKQHPGFTACLSFALVVAISLIPPVERLKAAPPHDGGNSQSNIHRDDPCDQLPTPLGNANGIDKKCLGGGSSSGIAKGDFNGDGFADLAIGVPDEDLGTATNAGGVNIIYGSANGLTTSNVNVPAAQFWAEGLKSVPGVAQSGDRFGAALASGDFNGDGYSDLAIGIPGKIVNGNSNSGAVVIIYGSRNGLTASDSAVPAPQSFNLTNVSRNPNTVVCGRPPLSDVNFGQSLAWGDFNHDGKGELAVGIPGYIISHVSSFTFLCEPDEFGAVWVVGGNNGGLTLSGNQLWISDDIPGATRSYGFGTVLTTGDFNGDGYSDLAIGTPLQNIDDCGLACTVEVWQAGAVEVLYGSSNGLTANGSQVWTQNSSGIIGSSEDYDHFGATLAAGDFNGDGITDLAVGVPNEDVGSIADAGAVNIIYGSSTGLTATGNQFWDQIALGGVDEVGAQFGRGLAAGNFNGDGWADLAVGVPLKDIPGVTDAGEVDVIYGSASGLSIAARSAQIWREGSSGIAGTPQQGDRFGISLSAWNFGRNETIDLFGHPVTIQTADLAIGVSFKDVGTASDAGAVNVIYGSFLGGLTSTNNQLWTQNSQGMPCCSESGDHFGAAVY